MPDVQYSDETVRGNHPMPTVLCSGETMALLHSPHGGRLRHAVSLELRIGGAESTVAIALARLGFNSGWISRVGNDELGELVLSKIRAEGVDVSRVKRSIAPTGLYLRDSVSTGPRVFYYRQHSAASELAPEAFDLDYLKGADVLHMTGITPALSNSCRQYTQWALERARQRGVTVSFDVNYRSKLWDSQEALACLETFLPYIDILFISDEEARALWQRDDGGLLEALAAKGPSQILIKHGGDRCVALLGGRLFEAPAFPVEVVDTTGAGDAFAAGYLAAKLWGLPPERSLRIAQAMGACCVSGAGDYENLPDKAELMRFVDGKETLGR